MYNSKTTKLQLKINIYTHFFILKQQQNTKSIKLNYNIINHKLKKYSTKTQNQHK